MTWCGGRCRRREQLLPTTHPLLPPTRWGKEATNVFSVPTGSTKLRGHLIRSPEGLVLAAGRCASTISSRVLAGDLRDRGVLNGGDDILLAMREGSLRQAVAVLPHGARPQHSPTEPTHLHESLQETLRQGPEGTAILRLLVLGLRFLQQGINV